MRGGFGGFDIWKCERESESALWGEPENMGSSINSTGDELYPYIRKDGNLYFSSDFWEGMGGLDIFKAQKDEFGIWQRMNMMYPVNSSQDDFGIVFQGKREIGMFSSTRDGGKGGDDIYSFILPELELNVAGKVIDKSTAKPIEEASVTLIGSDGSIKETKTKSDGSFKFNLSQYIDYLVVGTGEGYLKKKKRFSTNNIIDDTTFVSNIELITISKAVEIPNIFYDFGKWTLNESSKTALEELAQLLEDNPNITIEMGAHTDMVGDSAANMKLSIKRAESVVSYLKEKGYDSDRLVARGYGENRPVAVDEKLALTDTIFVEGQVLDQNFILAFEKDKQDKINQINRRTELRILNTNYIPKPEYFLKYKKNKMKFEENLN
ncbi:MAG: OmpA family protein [Bacteroidales bacterium]|nr:OmpA family protein [Bacteroidales bacterium]